LKYLFFILFFSASCSISGQHHLNFTPTSFSNKFSLNIEPVLKIHEGDTIKTETVDASGADKNGIKKTRGGNPLTGPFYIENASAGDILAVTLTKISLNRSYAFTTESFVDRSLPKNITEQFKKPRIIKWKLDTQNNFASPDTSYEHLQNFKIPLNPFLGCVGVAPSNNKNEILSFFQGNFGGNLDYSMVRQSSTIYLPVFHDGAFLFLGDAHAAQGDGELAGNALETSMDVEFTVRIIKAPSYNLAFPRIEDSNYIMAMGIDKSLDDALKLATKNLIDWLQTDYKLSIQEASQVVSTSVEYTIAEIADPDVEIVAKIKKEILKGLKKQ
jgi:amidase